MRYLAEIQKQSKGFMGGFETRLKLLASQDSDRGWQAVSGKEAIELEDSGTLGDGALVMVSLNNSGQIQGNLEPASARIMGIIQSFSRMQERNKSLEEEIETWKESLQMQGEQLSEQKLDLESRLLELEQMEEEFAQFEAQRQEIAKAKEEAAALRVEVETKTKQLAEEEARIAEQQQRIEQNLKDGKVLDEDQANQIQSLLDSLSAEIASGDLSKPDLSLANQKVDIAAIAARLQKERQQLEKKRELLAEIVAQEESQALIANALSLAGIESSGVATEGKIDVKALENMPLSELEKIVQDLKKDLEKVAQFVHDQEEELNWQCQAVEEIEEKIRAASEFDRLSLENELAEEKEAKKMLDETLVGQRRSLKERHERFLQHSRILKRRQGIFDIEIELQEVDLEPLKKALATQQEGTEKKRKTLESEIAKIQQTVLDLQSKIQQKIAQDQSLADALQEPFHIQEVIKQIKKHLENLTSSDETPEANPSQALNQIRQTIEELACS